MVIVDVKVWLPRNEKVSSTHPRPSPEPTRWLWCLVGDHYWWSKKTMACACVYVHEERWPEFDAPHICHSSTFFQSRIPACLPARKHFLFVGAATLTFMHQQICIIPVGSKICHCQASTRYCIILRHCHCLYYTGDRLLYTRCSNTLYPFSFKIAIIVIVELLHENINNKYGCYRHATVARN
jgi:hypothetical protein